MEYETRKQLTDPTYQYDPIKDTKLTQLQQVCRKFIYKIRSVDLKEFTLINKISITHGVNGNKRPDKKTSKWDRRH